MTSGDVGAARLGGAADFSSRLGSGPVLGSVPTFGAAQTTLTAAEPAVEALTLAAAADVAGRVPEGAHLVALDVDGTLMTFDEFISEEIREVIPALRAAGHEVVLATGRPLVAVLPVAADLGIDDGWVVSSNGSVTARLTPGEGLGFLLDDVVRFAPRAALEVMGEHMPNAQIAMEEIGVGFWVSEGFPGSMTHGLNSVIELDRMCSLEAVRIVVADAEAPTRSFDEAIDGLGLVATSFMIAGTRWMDIAPVGLTKAYALERLRALCSVPVDQTLAIGDGGNDVAMLGWAGRGVAMGHAEAAVIAAADEVTLSISDDGALPVLRGLLDGSWPAAR